MHGLWDALLWMFAGVVVTLLTVVLLLRGLVRQMNDRPVMHGNNGADSTVTVQDHAVAVLTPALKHGWWPFGSRRRTYHSHP